ncbi:hypothetical protein [Moorena producens]|uniref:hypothetical protein n=1 Tax=Moorena producens TaxID=1155739 RepID=UPI0011EA6238|nr:hypothetical protein [Moorena producens]
MGRWGDGEMGRWGRFLLSDAARSWGASAVLGRQRGLGGSPRRRNLITLSLYGWSAMQKRGKTY